MKTKTILYVIIVILVISGITSIIFWHKNFQTNLNQTLSNQNSSNQKNQSPKILLSNSQYAPYSYLISGGSLSSQAKVALSGFNMTSSNLQNGSQIITVSVIGTSNSKKFTLAPGYKLYIVETSFGDDNLHYDSSLGDDGFIITDPNGYIVA